MQTLAMGPFLPAIMEMTGSEGRVVCTSFHISYQYPDTVKFLTNWVRRHWETSRQVQKDRKLMHEW